MKFRQEFLSEEDLDLANLSWDELVAVWNQWLLQAQTTNEVDRHLYEHGVFLTEPVDEEPVPSTGNVKC